MPPESLEMEPLREKLLRRSMDNSFSDVDNSDDEDDIVVHGSGDEVPSTEDRQLLNEEDEREKLLTKKRKVIIGSNKHARRKSTESYMESGQLDSVLGKVRKPKVRQTLIDNAMKCSTDVLRRDDDVRRRDCYVVI